MVTSQHRPLLRFIGKRGRPFYGSRVPDIAQHASLPPQSRRTPPRSWDVHTAAAQNSWARPARHRGSYSSEQSPHTTARPCVLRWLSRSAPVNISDKYVVRPGSVRRSTIAYATHRHTANAYAALLRPPSNRPRAADSRPDMSLSPYQRLIGPTLPHVASSS